MLHKMIRLTSTGIQNKLNLFSKAWNIEFGCFFHGFYGGVLWPMKKMGWSVQQILFNRRTE